MSKCLNIMIQSKITSDLPNLHNLAQFSSQTPDAESACQVSFLFVSPVFHLCLLYFITKENTLNFSE